MPSPVIGSVAPAASPTKRTRPQDKGALARSAGIGQALLTGVLAAEAVATAGPDPHAVGTRYREAVAHHLVPDVRFAAALGAVLRSGAGARAAVRAAGLTSWTRRNFARWMFEDYPRALVLTPTRWRRGALSGPGPYRTA